MLHACYFSQPFIKPSHVWQVSKCLAQPQLPCSHLEHSRLHQVWFHHPFALLPNPGTWCLNRAIARTNRRWRQGVLGSKDLISSAGVPLKGLALAQWHIWRFLALNICSSKHITNCCFDPVALRQVMLVNASVTPLLPFGLRELTLWLCASLHKCWS